MGTKVSHLLQRAKRVDRIVIISKGTTRTLPKKKIKKKTTKNQTTRAFHVQEPIKLVIKQANGYIK